MKNQKKIKAIIFDFGGVLAKFDHMKSCRTFAEFSKYSAEEIYDMIFINGIEKCFDEGSIEPEEFHRLIQGRIGVTDISYHQFLQIWGDIFTPNEGIENVLIEIRDPIKKFILSNTNKIHWQYIKKLPVIQKFFPDSDQLILSFQVKARKPDRRIYDCGIKRTGVDPSEIIYIDDKRQFVDDFKSLGVFGINYDCQIHSIRALESALHQRGVI